MKDSNIFDETNITISPEWEVFDRLFLYDYDLIKKYVKIDAKRFKKSCSIGNEYNLSSHDVALFVLLIEDQRQTFDEPDKYLGEGHNSLVTDLKRLNELISKYPRHELEDIEELTEKTLDLDVHQISKIDRFGFLPDTFEKIIIVGKDSRHQYEFKSAEIKHQLIANLYRILNRYKDSYLKYVTPKGPDVQTLQTFVPPLCEFIKTKNKSIKGYEKYNLIKEIFKLVGFSFPSGDTSSYFKEFATRKKYKRPFLYLS